MTKLMGQLTLALLVSLMMTLAGGATRPAHAQLPTCAALATNPANGLAGAPAVKSASSAIVPANGANAAYCLVRLLYGTNASQNINILVALPLSVGDGGSGRVQGAWNGRTQGVGGGGCAGICGTRATGGARQNWRPGSFSRGARWHDALSRGKH